MRYLLNLILICFFCHVYAIDLGSRESDPASLVENVSTIYGDYSEYEVDLVVPGPDSLTLSRSYSSRGSLLPHSSIGGWRFNAHCFLYVTTAEKNFDDTRILIGTNEGSILTYIGLKKTNARSLFKLNVERELLGLANTASGQINAKTNRKNQHLYFVPQDNHFELVLSTKGKRFYVPSQSDPNLYLLTQEILPSGNKIFYEYQGERLSTIKMTNASEKKVLSWIRLQYDSSIHIDTSDHKTVDYHFQNDLLSEVVRSHRPSLQYDYRIVDNHPLLITKRLPEGRFVQIDYHTDGENKNKVKSLTTSETSRVSFSYFTETNGNGFTQIDGPLTRKKIHRFDHCFQLIAIEEYLGGGLYRVHKKIWGKNKDATNLIATTVEDGSGAVYYYKSFTYDNQGNILKEKEYGNLTGAHPEALILDENGVSESNQESHTKSYFYRQMEQLDIIGQKNAKGSGIKLYYKKDTNILLSKFILDKDQITKRWFYRYNADGALIQIIVDDGDEEYVECENVFERHITKIIPKQELPNVGAPEIVEEKYFDPQKVRTMTLKKTVNSFDFQGNIESIAIYDANNEHRYTLKKAYHQGLLTLETDPIGTSTSYTYDANQNLVSMAYSNSNLSYEYRYDLNNRLIYIGEKDNKNHCFQTYYTYDAAGNKTSEINRFRNKTSYVFDDLGRVVSVTYPKTQIDEHRAITPIYTYSYDLFDCVTSINNPEGNTIQKTYTVRGAPTKIQYPDGTQEMFKYDAEGSLHRHLGKDGIVKVLEYDYLGRLAHIEYYERGRKGQGGDGFKREYFEHNAFHLLSHEDEQGVRTNYTYDGAGRLIARKKDDQKQVFFYDALGRTHAVKKWKAPKSFSLEVQERDLLDRVIEERTENAQGKTILKSRYVYGPTGHVQEMIGYPQHQESVLAKYNYDDFGRLCEIKNAAGSALKIDYEDDYIDEWGQKALKRVLTDPLGTQTEEIFDPKGRLTKTIKKDASGKLLFSSTSFFALSGNLSLEKNTVLVDGKVLRDFKTLNSYVAGKLKSTTLAAGSEEEKTSSFEYDPYGSLSHISEPGIKTPISYQYDRTGKLQRISYKEPKSTTYTINHVENFVEVELGHAHATYTMTPNDELSSELIKDAFGPYEVKIFYDGEGCIETIQLPDGSFIKYSYDGPLVSTVSRQSRDNTQLYNYRILSRDPMGHILEEVLPQHAGARRQTWDQAGSKTGMITDFFADEVPPNGYDVLHNIKKRIITLDEQEHQIDYTYNALGEIISEKGAKKHTYSYDSLGNRLTQDHFSYEINHLNQIVKTNEATFTFDPMGHLETKTSNEKTWKFQTNPLGHLLSIQDPNQTTISFTYDLNGKRLSKKVEAKGKKPKICRYFYLGQTELGCLDEQGHIIELKVPSNPNDPETEPSIAIEIKNKTYVPLYDLQGNVACLIDPEQREVVESYTYTAFGEEQIFNRRGKMVLDSALGNPWRYKSKRIDSETGLIYFGQRYYDPKIGRWISPDPMGSVDGPNLYHFCRNNPLTFVDHFGLASETKDNEFSEYFYCEDDLDPNIHDYDHPFEPSCYRTDHRECRLERERRGYIRNSVGIMDFLSNPRFQGSMQALSGLMEASAGGGAILLSEGLAAPLGWPVMAHGLDQFFTGMNAVVTGRLENSVTSQLLQETGIPPYAAGFIDNPLSIVGTMGASAIMRGVQLLAFPSYRIPVSAILLEKGGWVLPETGGGAFINGRWYTEHALERMAPRTPQVMATLDRRFLARAKIASQKSTPQAFLEWRQKNIPNPRGIPPSVIEAEIAKPGSTGVKVSLNEQGHVITVFPGGQ